MVNQLLGGLAPDQMLSRIFLWQTVGQLLSASLGPYWRALEYKVNERTPNTALSPAEAASAVVRGFLAHSDAALEAAHFGIDEARFTTLTRLAGAAPGPEELAIALRRGIIPADDPNPDAPSFQGGIRQGNLRNMWADMYRQLSVLLPTPQLALEALLEGQYPTGADGAARASAEALYAKFGGDPQYFDLEFKTRGNAPTPVEALTLANRGIIPWEGAGAGVVSYEQAFLEGPWRDKWLPAFRALGQYLPPPRTITAMVRDGSLSDELALSLWQKQGLSPELAQAYLHSAHHDKTQAAKDLARTTIEALYRDKVIERATAIQYLKDDGYSDRDADYLLTVVDLALQQQTITAVITRIRTLYTSYKITQATAVNSLSTLGVTGARQAATLELWDLDRANNMRELTPAQIESALYYKVIDQNQAITLLTQLGYTAHDAWIALSTRAHGPLPGEPARTAGNLPGIQT